MFLNFTFVYCTLTNWVKLLQADIITFRFKTIIRLIYFEWITAKSGLELDRMQWHSYVNVNQWNVSSSQGRETKGAGSVARDTSAVTDQSEMSYREVCEQSRGWWEGRGHLQAPSDEPDLVPATGNARVLVHGHHEGIGAEVVRHAHNLPQQADLVAHRLLRGRSKERPVSQSESTTSVYLFFDLYLDRLKPSLNYFLVLKGIEYGLLFKFNLFRWVCRDQQEVEALTWRWLWLAPCRGCGCRGQTAEGG